MSKRADEPSIQSILGALTEGRARKFDAEFPDGTKLTGINTDDDLRRAKDLMAARLASIGPIPPELQPTRPDARQSLPKRRASKPFSKAVQPYLREKAKGGQNRDKTLADKESTYASFTAQFGDPGMLAVDKRMAVAFKERLLGTEAGAGRVNTKIGHLADFFEWAIGNGEADTNPFEGVRISKKSKLMEAVESYEPFTSDDLALIFDPATFARYATKPHFLWVPFLLLYTGARPNELAGLSLADVRCEHGVNYFALKAAKNSNSIRKIPWHAAIERSSFPEYVVQRREMDPTGQLFPDLKPSKNGYAKNVSRRFNESYLPSLRMDDPRRRLYSFRATFITRMTELNVNTAMLMAIVGHFEQAAVDLSSPHFVNYQGAKRITALKETIDKFDVQTRMPF